MSSVGLKQNHNDAGYYITITSTGLLGLVYNITPSAGNTGTLGGTVSTVTWAAVNQTGNVNGVAVSTIKAAGAILKDLGKTVVSSSRTFRKVQLMLPNVGTTSTFGVSGRQGTTPNEDYLTGYIELGFEGSGTPAPVAHFGR